MIPDPVANSSEIEFNLDSIEDTLISLEQMTQKELQHLDEIFLMNLVEKLMISTDDAYFDNGSLIPDKPSAKAPKKNIAIKKEVEFIDIDDFLKIVRMKK